jgi:hypothetical protein
MTFPAQHRPGRLLAHPGPRKRRCPVSNPDYHTTVIHRSRSDVGAQPAGPDGFGRDHRRVPEQGNNGRVRATAGPGPAERGPEILPIGKMNPAREPQAGCPTVSYGDSPARQFMATVAIFVGAYIAISGLALLTCFPLAVARHQPRPTRDARSHRPTLCRGRSWPLPLTTPGALIPGTASHGADQRA